jgi:glycosyltransferase involved in cell wall biosynthesis
MVNPMLGSYENRDRRVAEPDLEPVDAIMLTLDAKKYLERTLDATYREVPVRRFFVVDGGSQDGTLDILKMYPRMEIHVRPDIKTTGKGFELLLQMAVTPWVVFVDCGKVPAEGWYDEMVKYKDTYDFCGSKRIIHYEFEVEDPTTTDMKKRPLGGPWMIRLESLQNYHLDDDYAWRMVDRLIRQVVEKNGYTYGGVTSTYHVCYLSDEKKYESDTEKRGVRLVFQPPKPEIGNRENWEKRQENARRGIIKYLDPDFCPDLHTDSVYMDLLNVDMEWIRNTNMKWFTVLTDFKKTRYRKVKLRRLRYEIYKFLVIPLDIFREYMKMVKNY